MAIERDLFELLFAHDCVIVPRFGGFLTHYRSARLDEQRRLVHPPSKDLSYNRHLLRTDGLLTDHIAQRDGIGFAQATAVIEGEVDGWHSKIQRDGRLELPRIGTFYRDAENNLQFDPDRHTNFLKDAYGLRAIPAVPVEVRKPQVVPVKEPRVIPIAEGKTVELPATGGRSSLIWAAAAVALVSTAATWWLLAQPDPRGIQWGGFSPFAPEEPARYTARTTPISAASPLDTAGWTVPTDLTGVHALPLGDEEGTLITVDFGQPIVSVETAAPDSTAVATRTVRSRYHIIGGCFLQQDNADGFVADLRARGFAASIIDQKGGLYRVAYGSYPDKSLAQEALEAVRKEVAPDAWLLVQ